VRTHPIERCPACHAEEAEEVVLDGHPLRRCRACGLVHAFEAADPDEIYVDGYLTGATEFGPPSLVDPDFQRFLHHVGHRRMEVVEQHQPVGRFLDVGCGTGDVLVAAQERGWQVVGAEPVEESAAIAAARGVEVRNALLERSGLPEGSYDAVGAFHVLEHMEDGRSFLQLMARWARPGGLVVVEVPNWGGFHRRRKGVAWPGLRPLEHVAHYDAGTLAAALARAGLEVVEVRSLGFLWREQSLGQALDDLARPGWFRALHRLSRPAPTGELRPGALAWAALQATQRAYDRRANGQVLLGLARRPSP
jgi:SAM-dependent methyltransferase